MLERRNNSVLVVEDDRAITWVFDDTLEFLGIAKENILHASSVSEAKDVLSSAKGQPNLILLNLFLAGGEYGLEFLKWLKIKESPYREIPVIVVTAAYSTNKELCSRLGAGEFVSKPFDLNEFEEVIKRNLVL